MHGLQYNSNCVKHTPSVVNGDRRRVQSVEGQMGLDDQPIGVCRERPLAGTIDNKPVCKSIVTPTTMTFQLETRSPGRGNGYFQIVLAKDVSNTPSGINFEDSGRNQDSKIRTGPDCPSWECPTLVSNPTDIVSGHAIHVIALPTSPSDNHPSEGLSSEVQLATWSCAIHIMHIHM